MDLLEMVEGCKRGETAAWETFLSWFSTVSRRILAGFPSLQPLEREQAVEEARVRLVAELQAGRLQPNYPGEVVNFVRVTVRRLALDCLRSRKPQGVLPNELAD